MQRVLLGCNSIDLLVHVRASLMELRDECYCFRQRPIQSWRS